MISYTAEEILALNPCWDDAETAIPGLFAKHRRAGQSVPLLDILRCADIAVADRVWLGLQQGQHCAAASARIADRAVRRFALPVYEIAEWAANWLSGRDRTARSAALSAEAARSARSAEAARSAALSALSAATARSAEAAEAALSARSAEAARSAALSAAEEYALQLADLIEVIQEQEVA